ncbi:MAG: cyclic nucleotide-binding domain-containing protein [Gammaproteobacteria bacterium]|nr:cyclic nucleotide-binding domain-containing protein [Gammaproteobacteria bacterium]MCP5137796.1 cyclic nucleotide-binding domain-containing protein [Gammaproteobacteria bacterium]
MPFVSAETIKNSPLGLELSDDQAAKLAEVVSAEGLERGMFLIEEGQSDEHIYVITMGSMEVVKPAAAGEWVTLQVLHEGDMIGELGFIDGVEHTAGVRALGNCEVFSLGRSELEAFLKTDPELVYQVMRSIMRTVHKILRRMNQQYVELNNYISKTHGRY